ncbi:MAG: nucleoside deaminase [Cyclobacteriaceae bacterium]
METVHEQYMTICLTLAKKALESSNPPVGAVLVYDDKVIGEGTESGKTTGDVTNHAEILAIRDAVANGHEGVLSGSSLYTTHEPCVMCSYAIRHHKIPLIVFSLPVKHVGGCTSEFDVLCTEHVPKWGVKPEIVQGILDSEVRELNKQFENRETRNY